MKSMQEILEQASDTDACLICCDAGHHAAEMFCELYPGKAAVVVSDHATYEIQGKLIDENLRKAGIKVYPPFIFNEPGLYAEWHFYQELEDDLKGKEAIPVAVGSGVVNDLCKLAADRLGRRYMTSVTAATMDGFSAYGSSVTVDGIKKSFPCRAPQGILIDPAIIASAPKRLIASGFADLMAKIPCGADWMIADALGKDPINPFAWEILNEKLKPTLAAAEAIREGDIAATSALSELLVMCGFAMQIMQSSRPASGAEHLYSHCWDMEALSIDGRRVSHGFMVGIGTLVSTSCLEYLLEKDLAGTDLGRAVEKWPSWEEMELHIKQLTRHNKALEIRCLEASREKYTTAGELRAELESFVKLWPSLKERIKAHLVPYEEVKRLLREAGAPDESEMIHVSREHLRQTFRIIPFMRNRYTNADLIYRLGLLDDVEEWLFGEGGRFSVTFA